jgi:hypothetical protein
MMGIWITFGLTDDVSGISWSYDPFIERLEYFLLPFNIFVDFLDHKWMFNTQTLIWWGVFVMAVLAAGREKTRVKYLPATLVAVLLAFSTLSVPSLIAASSGALRLSYPTALAALVMVPAAWDERRLLRWAVVGVCILNPLLLIPKVAAFQREMAGLDAMIRVVPERQVIQPVITEVHSAQFQTYPFFHIGAWYNFYKGGTNPDLFASVAHFPIKERRKFVPHPPPPDNREFRYETHGQGPDYFLVRTRSTAIVEDLTRHVPLVARDGEWMVFGPNPK